MMKIWTSLLLRQTILGALSVLLTLPLVNWFGQRAGQNVPTSGLILLGLVVVFAWISGGAIGLLWGEWNRERRMKWSGLALLFGLVWGGVVAAGAVPIYAQQVADELTREGAGAVWNERTKIWENAQKVREGKRDEVVGETLETAKGADVGLWKSGVARLPLLALLLPMVFGPALAAGLEAAVARRR